MTKQEEIWEGAKCIIRGHLPGNMGFDLDVVADNITRDVFRFQSSQGVAIKVERELPVYTRGVDVVENYTRAVAKETQLDMLKAGYEATIPLIEKR